MMVSTTRGLRSVKRALGVSWSAYTPRAALRGVSDPMEPIGTHWDPLGLTVTLSESEVSWGEVSEEDIPLTRSTTLRRQRGEEVS